MSGLTSTYSLLCPDTAATLTPSFGARGLMLAEGADQGEEPLAFWATTENVYVVWGFSPVTRVERPLTLTAALVWLLRTR